MNYPLAIVTPPATSLHLPPLFVTRSFRGRSRWSETWSMTNVSVESPALWALSSVVVCLFWGESKSEVARSSVMEDWLLWGDKMGIREWFLAPPKKTAELRHEISEHPKDRGVWWLFLTYKILGNCVNHVFFWVGKVEMILRKEAVTSPDS